MLGKTSGEVLSEHPRFRGRSGYARSSYEQSSCTKLVPFLSRFNRALDDEPGFGSVGPIQSRRGEGVTQQAGQLKR